MISANDLREKEFSVVSSGYDVNEVNYIIDEAFDTISAYANENQSLYHKLEILAAKVEEYREEEDSIKTAIITAQKMADKIKKESGEASALLISKSEEQAKETIDSANAEAEKVVASAKEYADKLIAEKTAEANAIVSDAQAKANDAISSAKVVAQDILDQAKAISSDLITKSKEEKEAYEILVNALKTDAANFVENLKAMYTEQLDALNNAKFETSADEVSAEKQNVDSIQSDIDSLVSEIEEINEAFPSEEVTEDEPVAEEPVIDDEIVAEEEIADEEEVAEDVADDRITIDQVDDTTDDDDEVEDILSEISNAQPVDDDDAISMFELVDDNQTVADDDIEEIVVPEEPASDPIEIEEEIDPMAAVDAFSKTEFTPIDTNEPYIPVIDEEPQMEEQSLFDGEKAELPFESYFNIKTEDAHYDPSQKISLIPPEDDDDDDDDDAGFKGFFKRKR